MQHEKAVKGLPTHNIYDSRLVMGRDVLPRVNAGLLLWREPLRWESVIEPLEAVADDPHHLSEQSTVAMAVTASDGVALPSRAITCCRPKTSTCRGIGLHGATSYSGTPARSPRSGRCFSRAPIWGQALFPAAAVDGFFRRIRGDVRWEWMR